MSSGEELAVFLTARLDEDEAAGREAAGLTECWVAEGPAIGVVLVDGEPLIEGHIAGLTAHIARHDPARVFREVKAKRAIIDRYRSIQSYAARPYDAECTTSEEATRRAGYLHALDVVMRGFATIWREHPDYDPEWGWGLL